MTENTPQPRTTWRGVIAVEDRVSVDGRLVERGGLQWSKLPLPLANSEGLIVGWVDTITRDGDLLRATGRLGVEGEELPDEALDAIVEGLPLAAFVQALEVRAGTIGIARLKSGHVHYVNVITDGTEPAWPETVIDGLRAS